MKIKLLAVILLLSLAGVVTAANSGNFLRNQTCAECKVTLKKGNGPERNLKKVVRNKKNKKLRWEKNNHNRNQGQNSWQNSNKSNFKVRRKQ